MTIVQLVPGIQSYDWGKPGRSSKAALYKSATPASDGFVIDESKPYAELWMGTHPSAPSTVLSTGESLKAFIEKDPVGMLGEKVNAKFGGEGGADLPFLFKVLCIQKALSIQAHPDKDLARRLHAERPDIYKDGNHKPEMAIAITKFSGFCGFLPVDRIALYLSTIPELQSLIPPSTSSAFTSAVSASPQDTSTIRDELKSVFTALMSADPTLVSQSLSTLITRYGKGEVTCEEEKGVLDLTLELSTQYPGDVGVFCVFLLNVVTLDAGQAVFLRANEPHAYISGDIMECMATSDNVVRAGLTPKLRDVPTLTSMLTYNWGPADSQIMPPEPWSTTSHTTLYNPPIDEFSVLLLDLGAGQEEIHPPIDGPSILIVTQGEGVAEAESGTSGLKEGFVFFIAAGVKATLKAGESGMVAYRAFVEA